MEDTTIVFRPSYVHLPVVWRWREVQLLKKKLRQFLEVVEWAPDLVHVHSGGPLAAAVIDFARERTMPTVLTAYGSEINILYTARGRVGHTAKLTMHAVEAADAVIAVSEEMKRRLVELGVSADKTTVIPNGVDLDSFEIEDRTQARAALGLPLTKRILLAAGAHVPVKGHRFCLEAAALLPDDVDLVLTGEGPQTHELRAQTAALGLGERVRFVGQVPSIVPYMNAADVLVSPSLEEGWPLALVESLACGTPVVATRVGGATELLEQIDDRLLVAPRDANGLAAAITYALARQYPREDLRQAVSRYSWPNLASRIASLYAELLVERS
jgi:glycosyltransferase involved in cell wall biosynthesis